MKKEVTVNEDELLEVRLSQLVIKHRLILVNTVNNLSCFILPNNYSIIFKNSKFKLILKWFI